MRAQSFEKKDPSLQAKAANNLAFLYLLEGDLPQATKYATLAVRHDRYNARALVNLGNALVEEGGELDRAKELYLEAIGVEADCVEAIFNLGLVNRQLGALGEAVQAFEKLHTCVASRRARAVTCVPRALLTPVRPPACPPARPGSFRPRPRSCTTSRC